MPVLCSVNYQFPHCLFEIPGKVRKMVNPIGDDLLMMFSCYFFLFIRFCCGLIPKTYTERVMKMQCYTYDNGPIIGLMSIDPAHVTITSCFSFLFGFPLWHLFQVSSRGSETYGAVMDFPFGFPTLFLLLLTTAHNPWSSSFL